MFHIGARKHDTSQRLPVCAPEGMVDWLAPDSCVVALEDVNSRGKRSRRSRGRGSCTCEAARCMDCRRTAAVMTAAFPRRIPARSSRILTLVLLATSLCAQDKDAAPLPWNDAVPPCSSEHVARALEESTRHGEWVDVPLADGSKMESWVVYPERKDKAPVVLVIHYIRGMSDWSRALGDQLAQDGFIAIVPDFLSGKGEDGGGTKSFGNDVGQAIRKLTEEEVCARLDAAKKHGESLPSSNGKTAVVGFCWGGSRSFG